MGSIYHALDENLGISVAVKENLFLTDEYARQFQHEANILASLRHPTLPRVRDYFSAPNQGQYMVMDYVEGEDLRVRIDRLKYLPEKEALLIGIKICDALSYMHSREPAVVHRDVKPGNIRITPEGEVVLVDFGLAKVMHENQVTTTGARAMTPGYSPPEQYGTGRTDPRTDIYSLGATLYAALTGVIPEDGLARATGKNQLTPLRSFQPKVNRRIATVIEKSLAVEPDDRFQTADDFRDALIEASELYSARQNRLTVPPPPATPPFNAEDSASMDESQPIKANEKHPKSKQSWIMKWLPLGITAIVLLIVAYILVGPAFFASLAPTPKVATPTEPIISKSPAVIATLMQTPTLAQITITPIPPTATSTPKPTTNPTSLTITPVGGSGQIAFASNRSGIFQIWLMNIDGTNLKSLTQISDGACQPNWSPNGQQIAFVSPCMGKSDTGYPGGRIFTMNADGTNIQALPIPINPAGDFHPAWSPDGKKIAYTSLVSGLQQIFVYSFEDKVSINLSTSRFNDSLPAWSPSGKFIAFVRESVGAQVYLMGDRGENPIQFNLSDGNTFTQYPIFTPDGQYVIYSQTRQNISNAYFLGMRVQDQGTTKEIRIPPVGQNIGPVSYPSISPDGTWIIFESWPDGKNHDIYLMKINGGDRTQLTTDPGFDFNPVWRPIRP